MNIAIAVRRAYFYYFMFLVIKFTLTAIIWFSIENWILGLRLMDVFEESWHLSHSHPREWRAIVPKYQAQLCTSAGRLGILDRAAYAKDYDCQPVHNVDFAFFFLPFWRRRLYWVGRFDTSDKDTRCSAEAFARAWHRYQRHGNDLLKLTIASPSAYFLNSAKRSTGAKSSCAVLW